LDTVFVFHEFPVKSRPSLEIAMKRNIPVALEEDTARWVRVEAARNLKEDAPEESTGSGK
jgi:hypothetical protein